MKKPQKRLIKEGIIYLTIFLFLGAGLSQSYCAYQNDTKTIYVNIANTNGPWDGSEENPFMHIQSAIDVAESGDTIYVKIGTYKEKILIEGTVKNNIQLQGEDKYFTIIDGEYELGTNVVTFRDVNDIDFSGFSVIRSGLNHSDRMYTDFGIHCVRSENIYIHDNIIKDNGNGINGDSNSYLIIENNDISENYCDGIRGHSKFEIFNNVISYNGFGDDPDEVHGDGISIWDNAQKSTIMYNEITYNRVDGVWDEGVDGHQIIGNDISYNGNSGIHFSEGRLCIIKENTITNNGYGGEFHGYGINLYQSTVNTIEDNIIEENNHGVYLRQSQSNTISDNKITNNKISGINFRQTSSNQVLRNYISKNKLGIILIISSGFQITNNDIMLNTFFGMVSVIGLGTATQNYWGNVWGPYMGNMVRIIPPVPIVFPWSLSPNTEEVV